MIVTIQRVQFYGKWVRLTFEEGHLFPARETDTYHYADKAGYLEAAIDRARLQGHVYTQGLRGVQLELSAPEVLPPGRYGYQHQTIVRLLTPRLVNSGAVPGLPGPEPMAGHCHGYLAPDGSFFACGSCGHHYRASLLIPAYYPGTKSLEYEEFLEEQGWVKLSATMLYFGGYRLTDEQVTAITAWFEASEETHHYYNEGRYTLEEFLDHLRQTA